MPSCCCAWRSASVHRPALHRARRLSVSRTAHSHCVSASRAGAVSAGRLTARPSITAWPLEDRAAS